MYYMSALKAENLQDGQTLGMVNGDNVTVSVKDGKTMLNNSATYHNFYSCIKWNNTCDR